MPDSNQVVLNCNSFINWIRLKNNWTILLSNLFIFFLACFTIIILCLMSGKFLYSLDDNHNFFELLMPVLASILTAILFVDYTYKRTIQLDYNEALYSLIKEIEDINKKMDYYFFYSLVCIKEWKIKNHIYIDTWFPKEPSYGLSYGLYQRTHIPNWERLHGVPGFLLQYLPSKAYYNFMEKGHYKYIRIQKRTFPPSFQINNHRIWNLMEMYDYCIEFSQRSQFVEQRIHDLFRSNDHDLIAGYYGNIIFDYNRIKEIFDKKYSEFNPNDKKGLELTISDMYLETLYSWILKKIMK